MEGLNGNFNKEGHKEALVSSGVHALKKRLKNGTHALKKQLKNGTLFSPDGVPTQCCIP